MKSRRNLPNDTLSRSFIYQFHHQYRMQQNYVAKHMEVKEMELRAKLLFCCKITKMILISLIISLFISMVHHLVTLGLSVPMRDNTIYTQKDPIPEYKGTKPSWRAT